MVRSRITVIVAAFVYISLALLPVVGHGQTKALSPTVTVYKTPT